MKPKPKGTKSEGLLLVERGLGRPESVLKMDFVMALSNGEGEDMLPFSGKFQPQLPTKECVVKLYVFLKSQSVNR